MVRSLFHYPRIALRTAYLEILFFIVIQHKISEAHKVAPSFAKKEKSYNSNNNNHNHNHNHNHHDDDDNNNKNKNSNSNENEYDKDADNDNDNVNDNENDDNNECLKKSIHQFPQQIPTRSQLKKSTNVYLYLGLKHSARGAIC